MTLAKPRLGQARFAKGGKLTLWADAAVPAPTVRLGSRRDPIVPLVSSGVSGPLGLLHLPRMWLEGMLAGGRRLAPDFATGAPLFDALLCGRLDIEPGALRAYLSTPPLPDYLACERWVRANAGRTDAPAIAQVNNAVRKATENGISLVLRDDLRAWDAVHASLRAHRGAAIEPIVPAISSRTPGPLGVDHLPRLWLKNKLKLAGALPIGYRAGAVRVVTRGLAYVAAGIDAVTYRAIGLDLRASVAFIESTNPSYAEYEAWVRANAQRLDVASVAWHNSVRGDTRAAKAAVEKAYAGWDDPTNWGYLVDDLIDWKLLHDIVTGTPVPFWTGP